jgi:hypothetical protein
MEQGAEISPAIAPRQKAQRARRLKIFQPAEMRVGLARTRVHLLDISATGALLHCVSPPTVGALVEIRCVDMTLIARVARHGGTRLGVHFVSPLSEAQRDHLVAVRL